MLKNMKKYVSLLLVMAIIAGIVMVPGVLPTVTAVEQEPVNLLSNPGFETVGSITGWKANYPASTLVSGDYAKDGKYSLRILDTREDVDTRLWSEQVAVTPGTTYVASAQVKGQGLGYVYLRFYDASGAAISAAQKSAYHNGTEEWTLVSVEGEAPEGAKTADVLLCIGRQDVGDLYFDCVSLAKKPETAPVDTEILVEDFSQLTMNTNKGVPSGWNCVVDCVTITMPGETPAERYLDMNKTAVSPDNRGRNLYVDIVSDITAGKTYKVTCRMKGVASNLYLRTDSNNNRSTAVPAAADWTPVEFQLVPTADASSIRVTFALGVNTIGSLQVDDIRLVEVAEAPAPLEDVELIAEDFEATTVGSDGKPSGWSCAVDTDISYAVETVNGSKVLVQNKTAASSSGRNVYKQVTYAVKANTTYRVEFDYASTAVGSNGAAYNTNLYLNTYFAGGGGERTITALPNTNGQWQHMTAELVTTTEATSIRVTFAIDSTVTGTVKYDNVRLVEVAPEPESEENRLANPSFEEPVTISDWNLSVNSGTVTSVVSDVVKSGSYALKVIDTTSGADVQHSSKKVNITAGNTYTVSANICGCEDVDGSQYAYVYIRYFDEAGNRVGQKAASARPTAGEWKTATVTLEAPESAVTALVLLSIDRATQASFIFDDISLVDTTPEEEPEASESTGVTETTGTTESTGTTGTTESTQSSEPAGEPEDFPIDPETGAVIIFTDDFDDSVITSTSRPTGWKGGTLNNITYSMDTSFKVGETGKSLKQTANNPDGSRTIYIEKTFPVKAGNVYTATMQYYGNLACQFYITTFSASGAELDKQNAGSAGKDGQWTTLTNTIVAKQDADIIRITIGLSAGAVGDVYYDNLKVTESDPDMTKIIWDDFENSVISKGLPKGWKGTVDEFAIYTLEAGNGGTVLKQVKTGSKTRTVYIEKEFQVEAGKLYRAEVDFLGSEDANIQFWLQTYNKDENDNYTLIDSQNKGRGDTKGEWVHLVNEFVATENANTIRFTVGIGDSHEGTAWFDNVRVGEYDAPEDELENDPSILYQEKFDNVAIDNEGMPGGWSGTLPADSSYSLADGAIYLHQIKDLSATKSRYIYFETPWNVQPGKTYRVEMDAMGGSNLAVYFTTFANKVQMDNLFGGKAGKDTKWIHITEEFTVEQAADTLRVTIGLEGLNSGSARFDNIFVYEVNEGGDILVAEQNFTNTKLQVTGIPKGWSGSAAADTQYRIVNNGKVLQLKKETLTAVDAVLSVTKEVSIEAGKHYAALLDFLGDGKCTLTVEVLDGNSVIQTASKKIGGDAALWSTVEVEFEAEKNASAVRLTIEIPKNSVGTFSLDNLILKEDTRLNEVGETVIFNSSFEIGKDENGLLPGWSIPATANQTEITSVRATDGKNSLKLFDELPKGGVAVYSDRFPVDANGYYRVQVDTYGNAPFHLMINFYNKYGTLLSTEKANTTRDGNDWFVFKITASAPEGTVDARICLATTAAGLGTQWFDNVQVVKTGESAVAGGTPSTDAPESGWDNGKEEHPKLYFTAEQLVDIKAFANDTSINAFGYSGADVYKELLEEANRYLTEKTYSLVFQETTKITIDLDSLPDFTYLPELHQLPEGYTAAQTYPYWDKLTSPIRSRVETLLLAYAISGEVKYANRAIKYATDFCSWEYWRDLWHNESTGTYTNMHTTHIVAAVSAVYDICYDILSAEQRQMMRDCIKVKGLDYLYDDLATLSIHNYYICRMSGLLIGTCAIYDGSEELQDYLTRGYNFCKWYLDYLAYGGNQEGHSYNDDCMNYTMIGLDVLTRVTGNDDLIKHKYFSEVLPQWLLATITSGEGNQLPISDARVYKNYYLTMSILNSQLGDEFAGTYLMHTGVRGSAFRELLYTSKNPKYKDISAYYSPVNMSEAVGIAGLRTGFGEDGMILTLIGNKSTMYHNHYDQNSFIFAIGDRVLAGDAGQASTSGGAEGTYGRYHGHNIIFVDGEPQTEKGAGSLQGVLSSNLYSHVVGSAAEAYGEDKNGPILDQFDRNAIMINHADNPYYIILDELSSNREHLYDFNIFTGAWNAAEIDGNALTAESEPTKGNKLTISSGGGLLYTEFVSGKPMDISVLNHEGGSPLIQAHSEKSKDKQYMTILSTEYGEGTVMEYSFVDLIGSDKVKYKSSSDNPEVTKDVAVQGTTLHFFRGEEPGDYIIFPFVAPESGNFELILKTACHYNYGIYKVYVDGKYITTYDACAIKSEMVYLSLGQMDITAGEHTLKMELVGTSSLVGGTLISAASVVFSTGTSLGFGNIYTEEVYDNDKVLGAKIHHSQYNSDIVLYNRTKGSISAGGVVTDGEHAAIIGLTGKTISEGFSAVGVTALSFNGTALIKATNPIDVAADLRGTALYTVVTASEQTVKLYGKDVKSVIVDGKAVNVQTDGDMAVVKLSAGTHTVELKQARSTKIEYFVDGSMITTTYDQNGKVVREHIQNADGTELLTENGKVLLRVYIDEDTRCLVKEELSEDGTFTTTYYDVTKNISKVKIVDADGNITEIDYQSDGTIVTKKFDSKGKNLEGIIQYPDGSVTKAEYKSDCTVTTKLDKDGNLLSVTTQFKDGRREEIVYNADGTVVTTTYAKGGKLASVHTKNADGTAVLVEYLEDSAVCTTKYDANGKITEKITVFKNGSYIKDGFVPKLTQGESQIYDGTAGLVFIIDDDIVNFKYVTINGEEIDPAYYIVEAGSIKVTLPIELLSILPNGSYTVGIVSTHGTVTASFQIGVADTGMSMWLWIGIAAAVIVLAGGTTVLIIAKNKKKKEATVTE